MTYRNKTYVCFDGDTDINYYRLMQAWHMNDNMPFSFYNAHDLNTARDTSFESSIKRQLRERILNTKIFIVLIGEKTRYLTKFVRWEMEQALILNIPIVGVNINGMRQQDPDRCPPTIKDVLAVHVSFNYKIIQYAIDNWPTAHSKYVSENKTGPYYYKHSVYEMLKI